MHTHTQTVHCSLLYSSFLIAPIVLLHFLPLHCLHLFSVPNVVIKVITIVLGVDTDDDDDVVNWLPYTLFTPDISDILY